MTPGKGGSSRYCLTYTNYKKDAILPSRKAIEFEIILQYRFYLPYNYEDEVLFRKGREFKVFFIRICIIEKTHC